MAQGDVALCGAWLPLEQGNSRFRAMEPAVQPMVQDALLRPAAGERAARGGGDTAPVGPSQPAGVAARRVHPRAVPVDASEPGTQQRRRQRPASVDSARIHSAGYGERKVLQDRGVSKEVQS